MRGGRKNFSWEVTGMDSVGNRLPPAAVSVKLEDIVKILYVYGVLFFVFVLMYE